MKNTPNHKIIVCVLVEEKAIFCFSLEVDGTNQAFYLVCPDKKRHLFRFTKIFFSELEEAVYEGLFFCVMNLPKVAYDHKQETKEETTETKVTLKNIKDFLLPFSYFIFRLDNYLKKNETMRKEDQFEMQRFITIVLQKLLGEIML